MYIQLFSFGKSLWISTILQSIVLAYAVRLLISHLVPGYSAAYFYAAALVLGIGSSAGWTSTMVMPDVFCAVSSILLFFVFYRIRSFVWWERVLIVFLFLFSSTQHVSIFLIHLMLVGLLVMRSFWTRKSKQALLSASYVIPLIAIGHLGIGLIHRQMTGQFYISKTTNAFLIGRLAETGILSNYLNEHCASKNLQLCSYRNRLPLSCENFLWSKTSFLSQTGGLADTHGAYAEVVTGVFSSPKYLFQFAGAGFRSMMKQMFLVEVGDGLKGGYQGDQLRFFGSDFADFKMSKQEQNIDFEKVNGVIYAVLAILIFLFVATRSWQNLSPGLQLFGCFIVFLFFANAFVNGALATPLNRYQARVFWLADVWLLAALFPAIRSYFSFDSKSPQ